MEGTIYSSKVPKGTPVYECILFQRVRLDQFSIVRPFFSILFRGGFFQSFKYGIEMLNTWKPRLRCNEADM